MRFTGLWRHPDFLKLWAGQTISVFGSLITTFALPITAILLLNATPLQITLFERRRIRAGAAGQLLCWRVGRSAATPPHPHRG